MHKRFEHVRTLPLVLLQMFKSGWRFGVRQLERPPVQMALFAGLGIIVIVLTLAWYRATALERAYKAYEAGDYNKSAELFTAYESSAARYNTANALYRAGRYEEALTLYDPAEVRDRPFAAAIWYNRGNTLVRLKEFAKAREAFARSLALQYDEAALENMMHILHAESQDHMLTGRQEGKKRAQDQEDYREQEGSGKQKTGGGSNQQSTAERNRGAGAQGKKVERELQLEFGNRGRNRLSSKQYELINQRSVHEKNPW